MTDRRILVVEDEPLLRQLVRRLMEEQQYEVMAAGSAEEALTLVRHAGVRIDLAIVDVTLPGMAGPALAARLPSGTRVLFISGYGDARTREELGAPLMGKPFALNQLTACVRDLIATGFCAACAPATLTRREPTASRSREPIGGQDREPTLSDTIGREGE